MYCLICVQIKMREDLLSLLSDVSVCLVLCSDLCLNLRLFVYIYLLPWLDRPVSFVFELRPLTSVILSSAKYTRVRTLNLRGTLPSPVPISDFLNNFLGHLSLLSGSGGEGWSFTQVKRVGPSLIRDRSNLDFLRPEPSSLCRFPSPRY